MAEKKSLSESKSAIEELEEVKVPKKLKAAMKELTIELKAHQASRDKIVTNYDALGKKLGALAKVDSQLGDDTLNLLFSSFITSVEGILWEDINKERAFVKFIKSLSEKVKEES